MEQFKLLRRRTGDLINNAQQNLPAVSVPQFNMSSLSQALSPSSSVPNTGATAAAVTGPTGTWERIDDIPALQRSSHTIDIVAGSAYVFGGEINPREPVDNDMHVVRLPLSGASADYYRIKAISEKPDEVYTSDSEQRQKTPVESPSSPSGSSSPKGKGKGKERAIDIVRPDLGDVPEPRVGHATAVIGSRIFLFGGRGGPDMKPLEEAGRVWVFDTRTRAWSHLDPAPAVKGGAITLHPAPRSYHCATAMDRPQDFSTPVSSSTDATNAAAAAAAADPDVGSGFRRRAQSWRDWAVGDISKTGIPQDPIVGNVAENAVDDESRGYGTFFIHAGCLASGDRASDIWAFDVRSRLWSELPSAPGPARGGTAICISSRSRRLFRFGGFDGTAEIGGQLNVLNLEVEMLDDRRAGGGPKIEAAVRAREGWQTIQQYPTTAYRSTVTSPTSPASSPLIETGGGGTAAASAAPDSPVDLNAASSSEWPSPRSVAMLEAMALGQGGREFLVLGFGERDPSAEGHAGAGKFLDDVWLFQVPPPQGMSAASVTSAVMHAVGRRTGEGKWTRVTTTPHDDEDVWAGVPKARGWLASAPMTNIEDNGILIWGGLGEDNKRLGDGWVLRL